MLRLPRVIYWTLLIILLTGGLTGLSAQSGGSYTNPVLAGDYPDPSIIRVKDDYWATATSSEWGPEFPLLHSRDLVNWEVVGAVFQERPAWSVGNYWAPEIAYYRGRYFIYYTARKKDGPLCVAVASAKRPQGPYQDHGPLICQDAGSIDALLVTDEQGEPYLLWKEDGNSRRLPTPIWLQRLTKDGKQLTSEKQEILRNDASWEAQLIEGPFVVRRNGWYYLFYSGNACCGRGCKYALGVARAKTLTGPWEKHAANPILTGNDTWKCPGHGSIVTDPQGRDFLLYHAYHAKDSVYVGRQALLDEIKWGADGWPTINDGNGPSGRALAPHGIAERNTEYTFFDDFTSAKLAPGWQWPHANPPVARFERKDGGWLLLASATADSPEAVLARSTTVGDYMASTVLDLRERTTPPHAGLAAYGDRENALGLSYRAGRLILWQREKNQEKMLAEVAAPAADFIYLRFMATNGHRFRFAFSSDGRDWQEIGEELDGSFLPPWDRGVRVALIAQASSTPAKFGWLRITPR